MGPREAGFCSGGGRPARLVSHVFCPPTSASFGSLVCCSLCMLSSILSFMKRRNRACGRAPGGSLLAFTTALLPAVRCVELPCRALLPCSCRLPSPLQDPPTLSPHRRPPIAHARRSRDVQAHAERYHCCSTDSFGRTHSTLKAPTGGGRREGPSRHAPGLPRASSRVGHRSRAF